MPVEVGFEGVHDVDLLQKSYRAQKVSLVIEYEYRMDSMETYSGQAFVLVKGIPPKAHHHGMHLGVVLMQYGLPIFRRRHLCIPVVHTSLTNVGHGCDRIIG